jgi:hypothetical protein
MYTVPLDPQKLRNISIIEYDRGCRSLQVKGVVEGEIFFLKLEEENAMLKGMRDPADADAFASIVAGLLLRAKGGTHERLEDRKVSVIWRVEH